MKELQRLIFKRNRPSSNYIKSLSMALNVKLNIYNYNKHKNGMRL